MTDYRTIDTTCTPDNLPAPDWVMGYLSPLHGQPNPHWSEVVVDENVAFFWNAMTTGFLKYRFGVMAALDTMQQGINRLPANWIDRHLLQYKMFAHLAARDASFKRANR